MRVPARQFDFDNTSMTPMIDVIFQLLIFFVCASAGQIREEHLPTELAPGSIESAQPVVAERPFGEVWLRLKRRTAEPQQDATTIVELNEREYSDDGALRQTLTMLAETAPEMPVILDIEGAVPLGDVVRIYDVCQAAHFQEISFATRGAAR